MKIKDLVNKKSTESIQIFLLSHAPDDELFTVQELSLKFNVPQSTIKSSQRLDSFKITFQDRVYYGSASAVMALQMGKNEN